MEAKTIIHQGETYSVDWLKSKTLHEVRRIFSHKMKANDIINLWKQANDMTEPTTKRGDTDKRKPKDSIDSEEKES